MSEPRLPAIPWQDDPEAPDREWFPDDEESEEEEEQNLYPYGTQSYHTWNSRRRRGSEGFGLAPDADLEAVHEGRYDTEDDGLFYTEGVIDSLFPLPEEEEPSPYAGNYSEE